MPGPYKGFSTQHTTKQEHAKPRHQPSHRDQRARDRLRNKASASQAKIKSLAYIALGTAALHMYTKLLIQVSQYHFIYQP